jgi:hypothetical protein
MEQVLAQWWCLVAFMKALYLLHWVMRAVLYRCIAIAIDMAIKVGTYSITLLFVCCCPGGR